MPPRPGPLPSPSGLRPFGENGLGTTHSPETTPTLDLDGDEVPGPSHVVQPQALDSVDLAVDSDVVVADEADPGLHGSLHPGDNYPDTGGKGTRPTQESVMRGSSPPGRP